MAKFKFGNPSPSAIIPKSDIVTDAIMDLPEDIPPVIQYVDRMVEKPVETIKYVDKIVEKPVYLTSYIEREKLMRDKRLRRLLLGSRREMRYMQRNIMSRLDQITQRFDEMPLENEKIVEVHKIKEVNNVDYKLWCLVIASLLINIYVLLK
jgi:hypothetical protein